MAIRSLFLDNFSGTDSEIVGSFQAGLVDALPSADLSVGQQNSAALTTPLQFVALRRELCRGFEIERTVKVTSLYYRPCGRERNHPRRDKIFTNAWATARGRYASNRS